MLKGSHIYLSIALFSSLLFGCGRQIPDGVIDSDQMEDILYDYHLAKVMGDELPYDQAYKKELYIKYVFDKYKITSAQFDSSMVWYSKHADELAKVYVKIDKRYTKNREQMKSATVSFSAKNRKSLSGDTLDIWKESELYWLTSSELSNKMTFNIVADTSYRKNDLYILEGNFNFLKGGKQSAVLAINITLDNDSVIGRTQVISNSGPYQLFLDAPGIKNNVRSVNGFIYYKGENRLPGMLASDLSLKKIHRNLPDVPSADAVQTSNSEPAGNNDVLKDTTMKVIPADKINQPVINIDTTNNNNGQPLRNDPRSIRDRSPRKFRPKVN